LARRNRRLGAGGALPIGLTAALAAALLAGCGGGASAGATVTVYVGAPLCSAAKQKLGAVGGQTEDLEVRAVCLAPDDLRGRVDLAAAGANARRATQDSAAVAYLEAPGPAGKFSRPIVESAGIAWTVSRFGGSEMARILIAIEEAGTGSVRDSVREKLE
jgi:hypothetical protein